MTRQEKLNHLIGILEGVRDHYPKDFYMTDWVDESRIDIAALVAEDKNCGFAGCAMGWACFNEKFKKMGLGFNFNSVMYEYEEDGDIKVVSGFIAAQEFFELTEGEAEFLFLPCAYFRNDVSSEIEERGDDENEELFFQDNSPRLAEITPDMVIAHIRYIENPETAIS